MSLIRIITVIALLFTTNSFAEDDGYPKTREERKAEEMGSIVGGKGIIFTPSKVKNESTKTEKGTINRYLWQAAIECLDFVPLSNVDSNSGVIITEWYTPKNQPRSSFKINVFIKDNIISPDAIEVKVFEKMSKNGAWVQNSQKSDLANSLEDKILHKARELYIKSQKKR